MKIALVGPTSLELIAPYLDDGRPSVTCHTFPYIAVLAKGYVDAGHDVHIVCMSEMVTVITHYKGSRVNLTLVPQRTSARSRAFDLFSFERDGIHTALKEIDFDTIHAHWTYEYASAALRYDRDALVTCHDSPISVLKYYHHPYWWFRELLSAVTLRRAKNLTVVSPSLHKEVRPFLRRGSKVSIIPNGIEPLKERVRKVAIDSRSPVFCSIANGFNSRKNSKVAIQAFLQVRETVPGATLILIGEGHEPNGLAQQWCENESVNMSSIRFIGSMENSDVLELLKTSVDLILHTSKWEACCIAIMEAQNLGVPVIGGKNSGGVSYSLNYGNAGILVDITDSSAVAEEIRSLMSSEERVTKLVTNASDYLSEHFRFSDVVGSYLTILKSQKGLSRR